MVVGGVWETNGREMVVGVMGSSGHATPSAGAPPEYQALIH